MDSKRKPEAVHMLESDVDGEPNANEGEATIEIQHVSLRKLIYKISDIPPLQTLLPFALQQGLLAVTQGLSVTLLVAEVVCARDDAVLKTRILSGTFFMMGLGTFCMSTFGVRLPIFQGPATPYIIPLFALMDLPEWQCPSQEDLAEHYTNTSVNLSVTHEDLLPVPRDLIGGRLQQLSGSLMAAGVIHCMIGVTGLVGFLLRFIGPITFVTSCSLVGLFVYKIAVKFSQAYWGVAFLTAGTGVILSLYLAKRSTPIPAWNRRRGLYIKWYPLHQVFAILISIVISWIVSVILTYYDVLSSDRDSVQFYARTDTQTHVITSTPWFSFPYPGQFGLPSFDGGIFTSFFLATVLSVLDSICDYSACARTCHVPQPPVWAVNRGIAVEGLMSTLSGGFGICHATSSYGSNIGAVGLTRVASRRVFQVVGLMYMALAVLSKVGAVFITIPYSILGGVMMLTMGIFIGVILSNLQYTDMSSTRNLAIVGISLLLGLMMPYWLENNRDSIQTGNHELNRVVRAVLSNPVCVGGFLACFLDNTVPGTLRERGIGMKEFKKEAARADDEDDHAEDAPDDLEEGLEVYDLPWLPDSIQRSWVAKVIRIFPGSAPTVSNTVGTELLPDNVSPKDV